MNVIQYIKNKIIEYNTRVYTEYTEYNTTKGDA